MLQARDIMTREVITTSPETPVAELSKLLENRKIGGVPVVDQDGRLVGIVTQNDLVEQARELDLPPAINILDFHVYLQIPSHLLKRVEKMLGATVGEVMSPQPVTVDLDTPVPQIAALMAKQKVHTIPVIAGGKIAGIIGKMDIIRALGKPAGEVFPANIRTLASGQWRFAPQTAAPASGSSRPEQNDRIFAVRERTTPVYLDNDFPAGGIVNNSVGFHPSQSLPRCKEVLQPSVVAQNPIDNFPPRLNDLRRQ